MFHEYMEQDLKVCSVWYKYIEQTSLALNNTNHTDQVNFGCVHDPHPDQTFSKTQRIYYRTNSCLLQCMTRVLSEKVLSASSLLVHLPTT